MKILSLILSIVLLSSCLNKGTSKSTKESEDITPTKTVRIDVSQEDSIKIQNLIRKVYEWNENNPKSYFNIGIEDDSKKEYIAIDWGKYEENAKVLRKTGFFSEIFIDNYKKTLKHIQTKLKKGDYEGGWLVGYLPPFGTGANEWCHCQDVPIDDYWKTMEIYSLNPQAQSVKVVWNWGKGIEWEWVNDEKNGYPQEVVKESNIWKISNMDGFDEKYY